MRSVGFAMGGTSPISGYVLTATDSAGDASWATPGTVGGWTTSGNNAYETSGGNVGIGTTLLTTAALSVMNGNVGIGTWVPGYALQVAGSVSPTQHLNSSQNLGDVLHYWGTTYTNFILGYNGGTNSVNITGGTVNFSTATSTNSNFYIATNGNVGIGTIWPGGKLDVEGSIICSYSF